MLARVYDVSRIDSGLLSMMLQLLGETLHCVGMLQLSLESTPINNRPGIEASCSFIALPGPAQLVTAHVHFHSVYHSSTVTRLSEALLFLSPFLLSFFVSPIPPVFFLIDLWQRTEKVGPAKEANVWPPLLIVLRWHTPFIWLTPTTFMYKMYNVRRLLKPHACLARLYLASINTANIKQKVSESWEVSCGWDCGRSRSSTSSCARASTSWVWEILKQDTSGLVLGPLCLWWI